MRPSALLSVLYLTSCSVQQKPTPQKTADNLTQVVLRNDTARAAEFFLTLAAPGGACVSPRLPVTTSQLGICTKVDSPKNCRIVVKSNATVSIPVVPDTCFSGAITIDDYPQCPDTKSATGYSSVEFTLNPSGTNQETVDISQVNGYNSLMTVSFTGGADWRVNTTLENVRQIVQNSGSNIGNPGVYPTNCTTCTDLGISPCKGLPLGPCQTREICNVQRAASGGLVTIALKKVF
jgi:hypothetical protein